MNSNKKFVFSVHKIFTTWRTPFPNKISDFQVLATPGLCALIIAFSKPTEPCVFLSFEVVNTFLILSYFEEK